MRRPIYLDCHATTPVDPRVAEAMWLYFIEKFGNAASINHAYGHEAAAAVARAREQVGRLIGAPAESLVFTSGATEANNLAIKGVLWSSRPGSHFITTAAEHRAVLDPAKRLQREGYAVSVLPVDRFGCVDPQEVARAIRPETVLVSVMAANNEVGTISPIAEIGRICRGREVLLHCDAAQALGRIPVNVDDWQVDLLSVSGHKLYAPKGAGVLYVRRDRPIRLEPLFDGGGHEGRLRSGTLPVPLIVGLGVACEICSAEMPDESQRIAALRDRLSSGLFSGLAGLTLNGHPHERLPGNLHVSVEGVDGDVLMNALTDIAVSAGAACTTAEPEPSHVLRAMGVPDKLSRASLRFGLGRMTTIEDVDFAIGYVVDVVNRLRT